MVALKLTNFGGMVPLLDDELLPQTAAAYSENAWVYSGALTGLKSPRLVHTCAATTRMVFRLPLDERSPYNYEHSLYVEFADPNTDVLRAPVFDDTYERYYWASPTTGPRYNTRARLIAGSAEYVLGIPFPSVAPGVTASGGSSGTSLTRTYLTTFVSAYGEEGSPSDPTTVTGKLDDTWTLTLTPPGVDDETDRALDKVRIYRTITALSGATIYFLVDEVPKATTSYVDSVSDATIAGNQILRTTTWAEPPTDLAGFAVMSNGVVAGFRDNEIWFSEPYRPHAWPAEYALTVEFGIVGIAAIGQSLIVLTRGKPVYITGVHPSNMAVSTYPAFEPCVSRRSIVATPSGVFYASQNGLMVAVPGDLRNLTQGILSRKEWVNGYNVRYSNAARLNSSYFSFGTTDTGGVFEATAFDITGRFESQDFTGARNGFYLDIQNERVGLNVLQQPDPVFCAFEDPWTNDVMFLRHDGGLYVFDPVDGTTVEPYIWRSKILQTPDTTNLGVLRVFFTPNASVTLNPTPNAALVQTLAADQYGLLRLYADNKLVWTRELRSNGEIMRLPSGFKADKWQLEIEARVKLKSVELASTLKELGNV